MATISVPLTTRLERSVDNLVERGFGASKEDVIRKEIARLVEYEAVMSVFVAEQEAAKGKIVKGDIKTFLR